MEKLTSDRLRELWGKTYNREGKPDWSHLFPYYHENIVFEDSIQKVEGIEAFRAMCTRLASRCEQLKMNILTVMMEDDHAFLEWEMVMMFKKWPSTSVYGCTRLTLGEDHRIIHQRDYFDLWGDIINNIPRVSRSYRRFMHRYFG